MCKPLYNTFAARFAAASLPSLVETFNGQVGQRGFHSARIAHNTALIDEFIRRGIDVSAVYDGTKTSFAHTVTLADGRLVVGE